MDARKVIDDLYQTPPMDYYEEFGYGAKLVRVGVDERGNRGAWFAPSGAFAKLKPVPGGQTLSGGAEMGSQRDTHGAMEGPLIFIPMEDGELRYLGSLLSAKFTIQITLQPVSTPTKK